VQTASGERLIRARRQLATSRPRRQSSRREPESNRIRWLAG
jgi:hypothetical protein